MNFKGGGDAAGAARAVLETGEYDYAWNLQLAPEVLDQMGAAGLGTVVAAYGTSVERIEINQTDPSASLGDQRSTTDTPHPFLTDGAVVEAMSMAIDRELIVEIGYGPGGQATCNILPAPENYASTANEGCKTQDIEGAKAMLEEAGWVDSDGDGVREKDGVKLSVLFQTSVNAVRQDIQALVKEWWNEIGIEVELRSVDASVFFGGDPSSPDTFQKFYADVEMYTNNFAGVDPSSYLASWKCAEIPGPDSQWQGANIPRFCSEEFDALSDELAQTVDLDERARIAKELNDMLVQNHALIPLVHRGSPAAHANSLGGIMMSDWDSEIWNIKDWYRIDE